GSARQDQVGFNAGLTKYFEDPLAVDSTRRTGDADDDARARGSRVHLPAPPGKQTLRSTASARARASASIMAREPWKSGPRVASRAMRDVVPIPEADGSSALPGKESMIIMSRCG